MEAARACYQTAARWTAIAPAGMHIRASFSGGHDINIVSLFLSSYHPQPPTMFHKYLFFYSSVTTMTPISSRGNESARKFL